MVVFVSKNDDFEMICKNAFDEKFKGSDKLEFYKSRLEYEISVIKASGNDELILALRDFVKSVKGQISLLGFVNASLVAYTLGITQINPFDYDLVFELFINPKRIGCVKIYAEVSDNAFNECLNYAKNNAPKSINESDKKRIDEIFKANELNDESILFYKNDDVFMIVNFKKSNELNIIENAKNNDFINFENSSLIEKIDIKKVYEPKCFDDIITLVGLSYIDYKIMPQKQILKPFINDAKIIYSEQIIQIIAKISGFSFGLADILRRTIYKTNNDPLIDKFLSDAKENGYENANEILKALSEVIMPFSVHKAFCVSDALILARVAYIKTILCS